MSNPSRTIQVCPMGFWYQIWILNDIDCRALRWQVTLWASVCVFSVNGADRWWVLADFSMSSRREAGRVCPLQSQQLSNRLCSLWLPPCLTSHTALQLSNWIWSVVRRNRSQSRYATCTRQNHYPSTYPLMFSPDLVLHQRHLWECWNPCPWDTVHHCRNWSYRDRCRPHRGEFSYSHIHMNFIFI